ncbi:MAG: multiheme c-type cytochrome [Candidatus Kapaibacterium sp.]
MLNRFSYIFLLGALALAAFLYVHYVSDRDQQPARFTGVERCRVCHEAASAGAQFVTWRNGPHARAFTSLGSDSAKAYLTAHGIGTAGCISCHTTLGRAAENHAEEIVNAQGIGCERCHGPGSNYAYFNIMKLRDDFTAHSGVVGSLKDCYECHAASLQKDSLHCPFQRRDFIADSAWPIIRHPLPSHTTRPDTIIELRK